jgi:hypothetical protein
LQCNAILQYKTTNNPRKSSIFAGKSVFIDMDYIDFPRKLVYRERKGLEDFVEEHEEITLFIDNMLDSNYFSDANGKERALRCFNTTYYLCTIILQCKNRPEWNFAKYCDIAYCGDKDNKIYQAFTLSLVYIFLTHTYYEVPCKKLLKKLHDYIYNITHFLRAGDPFLGAYGYSDVCDDLLKGAPDDLLIAEEFIPRKIDRDIFRDVDGPGDQWSRMTNYYDRQEIRKIVEFLGKDEEGKHVLIELIDRDAQRFYGSNGAPYIQNVKPMLEEMDKCIYHEYNDAFNQAVVEAKIEELQYQGDVRPLQARIAELEKEVANLKEQQPDEYVTDKEVREEWMRLVSNAKDKTDGAIIQNEDAENKQKYPMKEINISFQQQLDEARKTIEEQEVTIKDLNETIKKYQMRKVPPAKRKGIALGLTPLQADIFGDFLANQLGINFNNKKEELSLILNCLFGYGRSSLANKMSIVSSKDTAEDRLYVASIFGPSSPNIAKKICSDWDENTLAPWEEDEEDSIEND